MYRTIIVTVTALSLFQQNLAAKIWGKVELAPAYIHLDVLEKGHTAKELDLPAIRADGVVIFGGGWCVKPMFMYGKNEGELITGAIGFGHCLPIGDCFFLTPSAGVSMANLNTPITAEVAPEVYMEFEDNFRSISPYLCLELTYSIADNMRVTGTFQWAWCHTHTKIKHVLDNKSWSNGPSYGAQYEYDLNKCWSVNVGIAYNESMGETKDGIRGYGGKIGIARWF